MGLTPLEVQRAQEYLRRRISESVERQVKWTGVDREHVGVLLAFVSVVTNQLGESEPTSFKRDWRKAPSFRLWLRHPRRCWRVWRGRNPDTNENELI